MAWKLFFLILTLLFLRISFAQDDDYFPPTDSNEWETLEPVQLGWCSESVDTLLSYLEARNSKSFIVLKDGKIVLEEYFNNHNANALWYWASSAKTLVATLIGVALENGQLQLTDPANMYLGEGWTSCSLEEESERTIWHQLTMTSSFDNNPLLWDCLEPDCFLCTGEGPGTEWHYHNGVYRKLIEVAEAALDANRNQLTNQYIESYTGMSGFWTDQLYWSNARDMARFGLLALHDFNWNGTAVLSDPQYIENLTTPSQDLNPAYGYLWWLNGQDHFMVPLNETVFTGWLIPSAPADMFAALGANDQKIYVVPSQNMVVIRQGNEAYEGAPAVSGFDDELWQLISNLNCEPMGIQSPDLTNKNFFYPNPTSGHIFTDNAELKRIDVFHLSGKKVLSLQTNRQYIQLTLPPGTYILKSQSASTNHVQKLIIQPE